eukprot:5588334-Karenia_brevis.AAC.1
MLWEASFLKVANFEEKLDLFRLEIQKSLEGLYQGFLAQLPGIFRDCAEALIIPKQGVGGHDFDPFIEEVKPT